MTQIKQIAIAVSSRSAKNNTYGPRIPITPIIPIPIPPPAKKRWVLSLFLFLCRLQRFFRLFFCYYCRPEAKEKSKSTASRGKSCALKVTYLFLTISQAFKFCSSKKSESELTNQPDNRNLNNNNKYRLAVGSLSRKKKEKKNQKAKNQKPKQKPNQKATTTAGKFGSQNLARWVIVGSVKSGSQQPATNHKCLLSKIETKCGDKFVWWLSFEYYN